MNKELTLGEFIGNKGETYQLKWDDFLDSLLEKEGVLAYVNGKNILVLKTNILYFGDEYSIDEEQTYDFEEEFYNADYVFAFNVNGHLLYGYKADRSTISKFYI